MHEGKVTTAVPARFRLPRLSGLAGAGAVSVAIKLSSAALNFLMFVVAAMVTDVRSFGLFSTGFAAASLVSFVNIVGQQSIILRYWPQHAGAGNLPAAYAVLLRSILTVLIGLAAGTVVFVIASVLPWADASIPEWRQLCLCAALMAAMLGWSEFLSSVFRARDRLFAALLPRDIVWRLAVIAALGAVWWLDGPLSAVAVTLICAGLLGLCLLAQTVGIFVDVIRAEKAKLTPAEKAEFVKVTFGLWGVNAVPPALGQANTLIVAGILGAEIAGGVFVAERTARLIDLPLNGINQVLAPHISRNYHLNGAASVQHSASAAAMASFLIALGVMAVFGVGGMQLLGLFDAAYVNTTMWIVLLIFGLSSTLGAACGPTALLLQLTGHQDVLLKIFTLASAAGIPLVAGAAWQFGSIGAAAAIALVFAAANLLPVRVAIRSLGVNPTVFGWPGGRSGGWWGRRKG
jgi:O-antigen/teichoic acid export membrane protein